MLEERFPDLVPMYQRLFPPESYGQVGDGWRETALRVREGCEKYSIPDRMPRPIIPGDRRALNRRVVEVLANKAYTMELENAPNYRIWSYRKAAWAVEGLEQDIGLVYRTMGLKGLQSIPYIGKRLGDEIAALIDSNLSGGGVL